VSFIETLAAQRQKLLDGLDANEGDINLRIFEDFYPDEAHFIYELLQNAEDAGASEASFELTDDSCFFEHDGSRHFDERDIRSITGIFNSSKKDNPDKIGKFGVGFKSVFVYTDTPVIYSKNYSFKILKLVLPQVVQPKPSLEGKTRFEFPFNNPKKGVNEAFAEIKGGLEQLSETTLLFLNSLRQINWQVGEQKGRVLREEHSEAHIEVLKVIDGRATLSSHWLRFAAPVENVHRFTAPADGVERQKVAIAYELDFFGDAKSFDPRKPLFKQLRITPSQKGKVAVFFPAEKETSGLRFHLHAPFIPELSRASIKNSPENNPLLEQLAKLSSNSLHAIKDLGLLTGEFLAVLPNNDDQLPERYRIIRKSILDEMRSEPLVPTFAGMHAPATRTVQARGAIKSLLADADLAFVSGRKDSPTWAIGASQKNSLQDKFLGSLHISSWDVDSLKEFLEMRACESTISWDGQCVDPIVLKWLSTKSSEWHQALYAVLGKYCEDEDDLGSLGDAQIVRMANGGYCVPERAYFQTGPLNPKDPLPRIDESVLTVGTKKSQQSEARKFLESIGVKVPGELEEIELLLVSRYSKGMSIPDDKTYISDLKKMMDFTEKNPQSFNSFFSANLFRVNSPRMAVTAGSKVFLDTPYTNSGLGVLHSASKEPEKRRWPLSEWYLDCGLPLERIARFAKACGAEVEFKHLYVQCDCNGNPQWVYLKRAAGQRAGNYISRDYSLSKQAMQLLQMKQVDASLLVWAAMCKAGAGVLQAKFQWNDRGGPRFAPSQLICTLRDLEWVPQIDGRFVKPCDATPRLLPRGFSVDSGYKWLEIVGFGTEENKRTVNTEIRAQNRKELGFDSEEALDRALAFSKLPADAQERILSTALYEKDEYVELPERPVPNADFRAQRVSEQAKLTPGKTSVVKPRAVQLGVDAAKTEAKLYLADQYTNSNGQMICQVCKGELPFKLLNGAYYFEAIEIVHESPKRYREGYLALCPNHAAAFQFANAQKNMMSELLAITNGNEMELELGGVKTTVYFTQMHIADAKSCYESSDGED